MLVRFLKRILLHLLILSFLVITLIPQNVTAANIVESLRNLSKENINYLDIIDNIPETSGKIFETNIYKNEKPDIILIYDVHCQPAVQKNIFSVINYFRSKLNTDKIFMEGAPYGKINTYALKNLPPEQKIKQLVFKDMLNKGLLSGTEFYSYLSEKDNLYGVEDFTLYLDTAEKYVSLLKEQKKFSKIIEKARKELNKKKNYIYNKDMKLFDDMFFGNIEYNKEIFEQIYSFFEKYNVNLKKDYVSVYKYLKIKEYAVLNKETSYEKDFRTLLNTAQTKIPAAIYVKLVQKIRENSLEQNIILLYNNTKQFLTGKQLKEYAYIDKLQEKNSLLKDFSIKKFLEEKNFLYENLLGKIFNTDFTKDIICFTECLHILDKYSELKADFKNFSKVLNGMPYFKDVLCKRNLVSNSNDLTDIITDRKLKDYYQNNIERNKIFVKNITENINKSSVNIFVVGGFHNEIVKDLKELNIKYVSVMPNADNSTDYKTYNKIMTDYVHFYNALADTPLAVILREQNLNEENIKIREFLISWIKELKNIGLNDKQIISTINFWAKNYVKSSGEEWKQEQDNSETEDEQDVTNFVLKQNKFSIKGQLLKIGDFFKNFRTIFAFKYVKEDGDRDINLDKKDIKKIERNIRHFPIIQIMLASELFESFATVFMQSSGFSLPFISTVIAVLPIVSFVVSGLGTVSDSRIPKKALIAASLIVHTIGTISFALSGFTGIPVLLVIAQVFPTIGIAALGLTLKPFLYEQLEALGKENKFAEIYGTNRSLFWFAMSISSLFGSILAAVIGQTAVVSIAVIPDIIITSLTVLTFLSARKVKKEHKRQSGNSNEKLEFNDETVEKRQLEINDKTEKMDKQRTFKENLKNFFDPVIKLSHNKKAFSYAAINVIVNNIFFVVLSFFFQPSLELTGLNIGFFGAIYFAADMMHSVSANLFKKIKFIVEKKLIRNIIFVSVAGLFALFVVTGHPIALILIFVAMNFWQGTAELSEDSAVYSYLDSDSQVRWNAFRAMFAMAVGFISQISVTGLLLLNIPNNVIIAGAIGILTIGSFIISQIFDKDDTVPVQEIQLSDNIINIVDTSSINNLLSAA